MSQAAKHWYAPWKGLSTLQPREAAPDVPDPLPCENRPLGKDLFVDLVHSSC
ncbi:hypothetical protein [Streptomyces sp. NBC_00063]|uniref:hypothetical protein n=1 Tax=Streptomyces sp. NBC_00063 TaxID=2975638 RepID=UPI00225A2153|nr:hypothetical protein [Streptomyces sp. NBC_00063]MCX5441258.1 hypothetical protein [Streptomyces sp. NBC_00063]